MRGSAGSQHHERRRILGYLAGGAAGALLSACGEDVAPTMIPPRVAGGTVATAATPAPGTPTPQRAFIAPLDPTVLLVRDMGACRIPAGRRKSRRRLWAARGDAAIRRTSAGMAVGLSRCYIDNNK